MPVKLEARYLSGNDIGKHITFKARKDDGELGTFTGVLTSIEATAETISEYNLCDPEPTIAIGQTWIRLEARAGEITSSKTFHPSETVILEGNMLPPAAVKHV